MLDFTSIVHGFAIINPSILFMLWISFHFWNLIYRLLRVIRYLATYCFPHKVYYDVNLVSLILILSLTVHYNQDYSWVFPTYIYCSCLHYKACVYIYAYTKKHAYLDYVGFLVSQFIILQWQVRYPADFSSLILFTLHSCRWKLLYSCCLFRYFITYIPIF